MKIAYVINSLEGGGAASPVPALTQVMRAYGAQVKVFALARRDGRALAAIEADGLAVECLDTPERSHARALRWLIRGLRDFGATHVWTSLTRATLIGQLAGLWLDLPVTSWQHNAYLKPANLRLLKLTSGLSDLWVGDSMLVTDLTRERLGIDADRLFCWPIFRADADAPNARAWTPGETIRIGSLGRLHPAKGYDGLIAAASLLRTEGFSPPAPFHFTIAGEGAERDMLAAQAANADVADQFSFPGFTAQPKQWLTSLHLYCQPSRREGLCIALHEAMLAGLPVIASRVGEMPHTVLEPDCGLLVEPENPRQLADALAALLSQPQRLAEKGRKGRDRVLDLFGPTRFEEAGRKILDRMTELHKWRPTPPGNPPEC